MKAELRQMDVAMTASVRMSLAGSEADERGCDGQGRKESKGWTRRRESTKQRVRSLRRCLQPP